MSDSSLNISGKIDSNTVALYESVSDADESVSDAANQLKIPFVVVGPSASRLLKFADLSQIQGKIKRKSGVYTCK